MAIESASKITANIFQLNTGGKKVFVLWARLAVWCGLIIYLSSLPNHRGKTVNLETFLGIADFIARKSAHLMEYFVLACLAYRAFQGNREKIFEGHLLMCFFFVLIFAAADEWHQTFVFGRTGTPFDVFIDSAGALAGYLFIFLKDQKNHEEKIPNQNPPRVED